MEVTDILKKSLEEQKKQYENILCLLKVGDFKGEVAEAVLIGQKFAGAIYNELVSQLEKFNEPAPKEEYSAEGPAAG